MTILDLTKPVQTRCGHPVRILCTDRKGTKYCVGGLFTAHDGVESWCCWDLKGNRPITGDGDMSLINIPEKITVWLNIYENNFICTHLSREKADKQHMNGRIATIPVEIEYTPGQGL